MSEINHVQHARLKISYSAYTKDRIGSIKKLLGTDTVVALITESDIITDDECVIVDVDYVKISDVLVGENGCVRYIRKTDLKQLIPNRNRYVTLLWNKNKDSSHSCLNVICLVDISQQRYNDMQNDTNSMFFPVRVIKVLGQSNLNKFDGGNTALAHLYRDILYVGELIWETNIRCKNSIDAWILPNGLFQKTPIAHDLLSIHYLQSRRQEEVEVSGTHLKNIVPDVTVEQPIIADMIKIFEDKLGYPLNYANCELLTEGVKRFNPNTVYLLTSSMIPLVNNRRGCLVKWNKRIGVDTLYWLEGLGSIRLSLRQ